MMLLHDLLQPLFQLLHGLFERVDGLVLRLAGFGPLVFVDLLGGVALVRDGFLNLLPAGGVVLRVLLAARRRGLAAARLTAALAAALTATLSSATGHLSQLAELTHHLAQLAHTLLAGLVSAADELIALEDGLLVPSEQAVTLLERGHGVLAQPIEQGLEAGFERLDLNHASAGAIRIPGRLVEQRELDVRWRRRLLRD